MSYTLPTIIKVPPMATELLVEGTVHPDPKRFTFTFMKDKDNDNDVLMTFDIRFFQNEVVRNYKQKSWGTEEKQGGMPFKKGERYELRILITNDKFQIFVNKAHFTDYKFYLGKEFGRNLHISGDTTIHKLSFPGCSEYTLPYLVPIPPAATELYIEGVPFPDAKRFTFDFLKGVDQEGDVLLNFDARFNQNEVIRNHRQNKQWGTEEKKGGMPFKKGERYEVKFVFKSDMFQIYVNKTHFDDFKFRNAKETGHNLRISGDTTINRVVFPSSSDISNPNVPFLVPIPGGLHPKQKIIISGVSTCSSRFTVNLMCGPDIHSCDVCLHFDVRCNYGSDVKQVVRNYNSGGSWGSEERHMHKFPFSPNTPFEIEIRVKADEFKIYVNDEKFANFECRIKPDKVTHLNITGDIKLNNVRI